MNVVYKGEIRFLVSLNVVPTKDNDDDKNILILSSPHTMNYYPHAWPDPTIVFKLVEMQIWYTTLRVKIGAYYTFIFSCESSKLITPIHNKFIS